MTKATRAPRNLIGLWSAVEVVGWFYIAVTIATVFALLIMAFANETAVTIAAMAAAILSELFAFLYLLGAILTLTWYYWSTRNLHAMNLKVGSSPLWAVLWFFIPFLSLWKPYGVTADLWAASTQPDTWRKTREPIFLRWWWGLFLAGSILSNIANAILQVASPGSLFSGLVILIPGTACLAASGVIFLRMGRIISLRQRDLVRSNYRRAPAENTPSWAD